MAPQAGMDGIALIRAAGIKVDVPAAQSCCDQPACTSGYTNEARCVARAQLGLFPQPWPIVVPSGSCAGMRVHHWPRLFADDAALAERACGIAQRVVRLSAFAHDVLGLAESRVRAGRCAAEGGAAHVVLGTARDEHPSAQRSAAACAAGR
jgi:L-lactate dehydrogenase complex protein LldE